jgi:hypothetical protein
MNRGSFFARKGPKTLSSEGYEVWLAAEISRQKAKQALNVTQEFWTVVGKKPKRPPPKEATRDDRRIYP